MKEKYKMICIYIDICLRRILLNTWCSPPPKQQKNGKTTLSKSFWRVQVHDEKEEEEEEEGEIAKAKKGFETKLVLILLTSLTD